MTKHSRLIALSLCVLMLLGTLAACATEGTPAATSGAPAGTTPAGTVAPTAAPTDVPEPEPFAEYAFDPEAVYEISWYTYEPNAPANEDAPIKLILEETYNVKLDLWYVDRSRREELLSVRFAAGEFPDVLTSSDPSYTQEYYKQGLTAELPVELIEYFMPIIAQCVIDVGEVEGVSPYIYTTYEGVNIGLPNFNYNGRYHYTSIFRKDWLDALGIDKLPETLEELNTAFYTLRDNKQALIDAGLTTQNPENIYGLSSGRIAEPFASIYGAFGSIPYYWEMGDDDKVQYGAIQPGMKDALAQLATWYADGILNPEYITGENRGDHWSISHDFVEGRILYTNNGPFYQNMPAGIAPSLPKGGRMFRAYSGAGNDLESYAVGRPPIGPNGDSGSIIWGYATGVATVFSARLENDKPKYGKILSFIEATCTTQEGYILLTSGVEGVHWAYDESGVRSSEGFLDPEVAQETYGLGTILVGWGEGLGLITADDPAYYAYADQYATYSNDYKDVLLSMTMPSSAIYWDELEKMRIEAYNDIIQGIKDVDYFDTFVEQWLNAGGQIITQEANDWYDSTRGN